MEESIRQRKKARLYCILNISGWCIFLVVYSWIAVTMYLFHWKILLAYFNSTIIGFSLTHFLRLFIKKKEWIKLPIRRLALYTVVASLIMGAIWALITYPINYSLLGLNELEGLDKFRNENIGLVNTILTVHFQFSLLMFIWCLLYFGINFFYHFRESEVEKWKLNAMVREAELQALKSQINPHFIFNSLNNIRSLVLEDPEKARSMITNLSGLLRYSIQFSRKEKVKLEDEIEVVKNYLKLESIQYEDRLRYKLEITEEALDFKIPPMIIQILVENAIKHGIAALPEGGEVNIRTHLFEDDLVVEVINSGRYKTEIAGTGIGLQNASERLRMLFGKLSTLTVENLDDNRVIAKFSVPITI
jgi:sensor histidine kinase YesM